MSISLGSSAITAAYLGGNAVSKIYLGIIQAWPTGSAWSPLDLFAAGEQGAWYDPSDLTTLYQDSAGTTPVTAVEQYIGLMLDKRQAVYQTYAAYVPGALSSYLNISNTSSLFGSNVSYTVEGWFRFVAPVTTDSANFVATGLNVAPNRWVIDINATSSTISLRLVTEGNAVVFTGTSMPCRLGDWVHLAVVNNVAANTLTFYVNGVAAGSRSTVSLTSYSDIQLLKNSASYGGQPYYASNIRILNNVALYSGNFTTPKPPLSAIAGTSLLTCQSATFVDNSTNAFSITAIGGITTSVASVSVGGNHAFQATSTKRPVLSARVNLLTKTEDFSDAAWVKQGVLAFGSGSVSDATTSPLGGNTADSISESATLGSHRVIQTITSSATELHTASIYLKQRSVDDRRYATVTIQSGATSIRYTILVDLQLCEYRATYTSGTPVSPVYTIVNAGNGWCKVTVSMRADAGTSTILLVCIANSATPDVSEGLPSHTGDITKGIYIWGADLRVANDGVNLPAYQRINTATDYDTVGFPKGDKFDGIDDFQITSSGGGGSSAFFFCAAIRAGKVGATQTLFSDTGTNTGYRIRINASNQLEFSAGNGSSYTTVVTTATLAIGQRAVVTCWHDGVNLNAQINNGTVAQAAFATASAGTAQTTIGADNNAASSFFTGSVYESIYVKNDVLTAAQILSSQQYCATIGKITL